MAEAAAAPVKATPQVKEAAPVPAAAETDDSGYWVTLIDVRIPMGNILVSRRAGTILHPQNDAPLIAALKNAYSKPPSPIRKLSFRDYEVLILRGRL